MQDKKELSVYAFTVLLVPGLRPILPYIVFHSLASADFKPLTHFTDSFFSPCSSLELVTGTGYFAFAIIC